MKGAHGYPTSIKAAHVFIPPNHHGSELLTIQVQPK